MALKVNALYSEASRGPLKRIQPAEGPGAKRVATFANVAGGPTLPVGTPVYVDLATGFLKKVVVGATLDATNDIFGIICDSDVILDATSEVLGTIMVQGSIHYEEILAIHTAGVLAGTVQELKNVLRKPTNWERGIVIEGLAHPIGNAGITA